MRSILLCLILAMTQGDGLSNPSDSMVGTAAAITDSVPQDSAVDTLVSQLYEVLMRLENKLDAVESPRPTWIERWLPLLIAMIAAVIALLQVKANIVSTARVRWTQNLRISLSKYLGVVTQLTVRLRLIGNSSEDDATKRQQYDSLMKDSEKWIELGDRVVLYLNDEEPTHKRLQDLIAHYEDVATTGNYRDVDLQYLSGIRTSMVNTAKMILKDSWEDAKTFISSDLFKFRRNPRSRSQESLPPLDSPPSIGDDTQGPKPHSMLKKNPYS
jgi:hypothetical protein